uniref:Uncharacterized protein n=1 Tax=Tanacetum cinerariifolium TaxID=118510 RepID=A0A6L2JSR0_TANCI|nr:hypothetical protein [Tanacetum cinerariifolium]
MPVEKKSNSKKHDRRIPIGQKFSLNKSSAVYLKTTPPRSGLTWKPTGRIFTQIGLKWITIKNSVEACFNTNDSASPLGKETCNLNTNICANSSSLSAVLTRHSKSSAQEKKSVRFSALYLHKKRNLLYPEHNLTWDTRLLKDLKILAGNLVKEILPKLNLPDHMYSIYTIKQSSWNQRNQASREIVSLEISSQTRKLVSRFKTLLWGRLLASEYLNYWSGCRVEGEELMIAKSKGRCRLSDVSRRWSLPNWVFGGDVVRVVSKCCLKKSSGKAYGVLHTRV